MRLQLHKERVWLVPLRLFVAAFWLRAFGEKVGESGWYDGSSLTAFLNQQLADGRVVFPPYRALISDVFLPHAATLGWFLLAGQCLVGVALLCGAMTNAALLGGIGMSVAFLLGGKTEPNVYLAAVQTALLLTGAGAVLGVDAWLSRIIRWPILAAQPTAARTRARTSQVPWALGTVLALAAATYGSVYVVDWSPGGSLNDPAAMVVVLAVMTAIWSVIGWLRIVTAEDVEADWTARSLGGALDWSSPAWATASVAEGDEIAFDRLGTIDLEWGAREPRQEQPLTFEWRRS